ncbi:serine/threonine-protein phosphatase [Streptomyces cinnabarinus]|uniref:Serine/threonine-protein phosphatase n=1 Tax=Streptomyces cinnabarinus TaxID=67287 RepID=A0ABY7KJR7_9ACTN|nr:PP2C family protein-serine/threonine phosphatase [Streptomyces cinnabarinus]WAZ22976.1 serine/threonine-protein phosphatase [Streptomyces cinnabarinus]
MSGRGLRPASGRPARRLLPGDPVRRHQMLRVGGRSVAWMPPLVLLIAIVVIDYHTARDFRIISWLVLVPGIAAAICGVWGTAAFALLSTFTYLVADSILPNEYQAGPADFALSAIGGVLATLACAVRVRGEARMLHMRDVAETIRRTVLRPLPSPWGGLDHAAVYLTADVEAAVGGDFYDVQPGPQGTRVLIGDVQGKGLGAVEAAAALLGTFREAAFHESDLAVVAERLETRMVRHTRHLAALGRDDGDRFATAVLLNFPANDPTALESVVFGHEPPLLVGPSGIRQLPPGGALPLGLGELTAGSGPPVVLRSRLGPDETVLLTTDGVTEARDGIGAFYPLADEVARGVAADPRLTDPQRLVAYVRDGTLRHSGGRLADDTTVFAVRRAG